MEFKHTLVDAQEARQMTPAVSQPTDTGVRINIIATINAAIKGHSSTFSATQSVATASEEVRLKLMDELIQLGYAVDGTTTPDSFIISWA